MKKTILFLLVIVPILPLKTFAVEGMKPNISYPLSAPDVLFKELREWKYIRKQPQHIFSPIFNLAGAIGDNARYNMEMNTGVSRSNEKWNVTIGKKTLTLFDSTQIDYAESSLHLKENSIILGYEKSSWFGQTKKVFSLSSYLLGISQDYSSELLTNFYHFQNSSNYLLTYNIHKLYGYDNMFTVGITCFRSHFLLDRKRSIQIEVSNRFAYSDYLFAIPGLKTYLLSKKMLTPYFQVIYLVGKHISLKINLDENSYQSDIKSSYDSPYISLPESLKTPINSMRGSFEIKTIIDTSIFIKTYLNARKTTHPLYPEEKGNFLCYKNMRSQILFLSMLFNFNVSKRAFTIDSKLSVEYTPYYEKKLPYFPNYQFFMDFSLHPVKGIAFKNNIQYIGATYDGKGKVIEPYYVVSSFLELKIIKKTTLNVGIFNLNNNKNRFIGNVRFSGRIITSGIKITF